jgi:tetratricopeptide (TPR) repeat protein
MRSVSEKRQMVEIPQKLARSIRAGQCVLWAGAEVGGLADRPGWARLLADAIGDADESVRKGLTDLIERGRLRPVLDHVAHAHADKLRAGLSGEDDIKLRDDTAALGKLPWAGCIATAYPSVLRSVLTDGEHAPIIVELGELAAHRLGEGARFVVHAPVGNGGWHGNPDLDDLLEEAACSRTNLLLGFRADDPDLQEVLDALQRSGTGGERYAVVSGWTVPEREAISRRYGVQVIDAEEMIPVAKAIFDAAQKAETEDDAAEVARARVDLLRLLDGVDPRADLGEASALSRAADRVQALLDRVSLRRLPIAVRLQAGSVLLAHGRAEAARKCFEAVASADDVMYGGVAHLDLAWALLAEGDAAAAAGELSRVAEGWPGLGVVPPGFTLESVRARHGARVVLRGTTSDGTAVDLEVTTLSRALGSSERKAFDNVARALVGLDPEPVAGFRGGRVWGRRLVVERTPIEGTPLSDKISRSGRMSLDATMDVIRPLTEALAAVHDAGLVHGSISSTQVIVGEDGRPCLRGFGPASALGKYVAPRDVAEGVVAPEVLAGAEASAKADSYAVAALAYRCLAGVPAVVGAGPSAFAEDLDPRVDAALARAMHPDASQRATVRELEDALVDIVRSPVARAVAEPIPSGQLTVPEDKDDLEAWSWVLDRKPAHAEARANIDRIEKEAREAARWDRVAEALGVKAQHAQVQQDRVSYLRELAEVFEHQLGAPANAFETMQALIEEVAVPRQIELAAELERLAEVTGKWGPLADSLMIVAERITDAEAQARMYERLGGVFAERLGATDRAIVAFEKAVEVAASEQNLAAIVPLYRKAGQHAELAAALLSLADQQDGAAKTESLSAAAAVLQDDLGDMEGAFATLRVLLDHAPDHLDTLERAETLARSLEDWDALYDILGRRADALLDAKETSELRHEAAQIAAGQLAVPAKAIAQYERILKDDRGDRRAADALVALLRPSVARDPAQRAGLIDALTILVDLVDTADERAGLLAESAALLDQEPDGKEAAADCRERILEEIALDRPVAQEAATALERWYRRGESNDKLLRLLRRIGSTEDCPEDARVEAWTKVLQLQKSGPLEDAEGALAALEALTKLRPDDKKLRDELLQRYLAKEDFEKAGPLIRAQVFDEEDPKRKAALLLKGGLLRQEIGKVEAAVEALEEAVTLDPQLWEAWLALRDLYAERQQPLKSIEAQVAAAKAHPQRGERVKLTYEAAKKYAEVLDKPDRALDLLEQVVELDPDHREATGLLVERLVTAGDLRRAWPIAQTYVMQVRSQLADDKALNLRALSIAGRCALAVDEKDRAREYLEKAKVFDATNLDVLQLLADLDMDAGRFSDALRNYQSVVLGVGSKMPPAELSRLYVKMADARIGMGEKPKAAQMAERALEIDPDDELAIEKLIELAPDVGGAAAMVKAKLRMQELLGRREARLEDDPAAAAEVREQRAKLLRQVAKLQIEDLSAPIDAVRTLESLLDLQPDDVGVLHQMLEVLTGAERWRDATGVLERLAEAQPDARIRAKYLYAGAAILREHLRDTDAALAWMRRVLEADPMNEKAFLAASEMLEAAKSFKELARLYRTRLKGLPPSVDAKLRVDLFNRLGEIYETHLGDHKTAIAAYNQAIALAPAEMQEDPVLRERRSRVMRLAVQLGDDEIDKAIVAGHAMIVSEPTDFETYHRLVELYLRRNSKDRARALSRTLVFLKQADEAEEELARETGGSGSVARGKMGREIWRKHVYHPQENRRVSDILTLVWPIVAAREGHTAAHHSLQPGDKAELALQSPDGLARFFAYACQVLDVAAPDYYRADEPGDVNVDALCIGDGGSRKVHPTIIAGKAATSETSEPALKFRAGRAVARARPEHLLLAVLPSHTSLRNAVYGAVAAAVPGAMLPGDVATEARKYAELYKKYLQPAVLEQLGVIGSKLTAKGEIDMRKWVQGATFTVTRAGFILCDNLDVAAKVLTQEGDAGFAVPYKERIRDLIAYSVSDPYLRVRKELGFGR